ncbi:MAG: Crp/Fnr family transcriptional regulator [Clostridia bacterium]|nr:Crp/Fnr family transcriptional regulator [Clostridia bacterium]
METTLKMSEKCRKNYLFTSPLFIGADVKSLEKISLHTRLRQYSKGEILAHEGSSCTSVCVILSGSVAMQKISSGGEFATIALLNEGDFFGEEIIYSSQNTYSSTLEASSNALVAYIGKDYINSLMNENPVIKDNFLRVLSDRIKNQNRRIELLSQKTLREKIAYYLIDLYNQQRSEHEEEIFDKGLNCEDCTKSCDYRNKVIRKKVQLPVSKEIVAKYLAMPRPSFSRELIAMEKDGLIRVDGRDIFLCDVARLETEIVEGLG